MQRSGNEANGRFTNEEFTRRVLTRPVQAAALPAEPDRETSPAREQDRNLLRRHGREFILSAAAVIVAALMLFAALGTEWANNPAAQQQQINAAVAKALASVTPEPPAAVGVYNQVRPSLVEVMAHIRDESGNPNISYGSGVVIKTDGLILTSLHVVRDSSDVQVVFADGSTSIARIADEDPANDIAFLSPADPPQGIPPAVLGNPNLLHVGDQAIVIGNPMQLTGSLSVGSVSGLGREFQPPNDAPPIEHMIQIDAAVNPGNSGGPLLNRNGEVVGIITGRASPSGDEPFVGIGFAVPIDQAISISGPLPY